MARGRLDVHPAQRQPLHPRSDPAEWKALLRGAGVGGARPYDARHTATTTLLLLGVPERAVMDMMSRSHSAMVQGYSHMTGRSGGTSRPTDRPPLGRGIETKDEAIAEGHPAWHGHRSRVIGGRSNGRPSAFRSKENRLGPVRPVVWRAQRPSVASDRPAALAA